MSFWIRDIPAVMRKNGWQTGAACMERWFRAPAREMSLSEKTGRINFGTLPAKFIESRLVTMDWALRFSRVSDTVYRLQREWVTQAAVELLRRRVTEWRMTHGTSKKDFRFGNLAVPAVVVSNTCQTTFRAIGSLIDPFDDFYAALGKATMHLAVEGLYRASPGGRGVLQIDGMGVYLRDSYDFNGDQGLGTWNSLGVSGFSVDSSDIPIAPPIGNNEDWLFGVGSLSVNRKHHFKVDNGSFRSYRTATKSGGDFTIFSDIHQLTMLRPVIDIQL